MKIQGAEIREQGVEFAIVVVKKWVVDSRLEADRAVEAFSPLFPGLSLVLAAQDHHGQFIYYGRDDISRFLASIDPSRIRWREYTFS